ALAQAKPEPHALPAEGELALAADDLELHHAAGDADAGRHQVEHAAYAPVARHAALHVRGPEPDLPGAAPLAVVVGDALLGRAGHAAQVRRAVLEDLRALLGVPAAGRGVERVDRPAAPRRHDPARLGDGAVAELVLRGHAPIDLAGRRGADVVAARRVVAQVRERVAARRDRLRLLRLELPERLRRELVRDHAAQVVLELDDVHHGEAGVVRRQHFEDATIGRS